MNWGYFCAITLFLASLVAAYYDSFLPNLAVFQATVHAVVITACLIIGYYWEEIKYLRK